MLLRYCCNTLYSLLPGAEYEYRIWMMIIPQHSATEKGFFCFENGVILDGSGTKGFRGRLEVRNGIITAVESSESRSTPPPEARVIDCRGSFLAPAFIDLHSHTDAAPFLKEGLRPKISQGIATETVGVCGLGLAPMPEERREGWRKTLVIGNPPIPWNWQTTAQWYAALRGAGMESNIVPFIGHGTLRYAVAGDRSGPLTSAELGRMLELLEEGFHAGAAGVSLGLIYTPALFAGREELLSVAKRSADARRLLAVHMRSESDQLLQALREITSIAEEAGCRLHISHLKAIGRDNQETIPEVLQHIDKHRLTFDAYPYDYGSTSLLSLLPPFILEGRSTAEALEALRDEKTAARIGRIYSGRETVPSSSPWDNLPKLLGWEQISIAELPESVPQEIAGITGKSIAELGEAWKMPEVSVLFSILQGTGGAGRMIDRFSCDKSVDAILRHPGAMVSSDTLLGGRAHPRVYGSFPRFWRRQVFESGALRPEDGAWKCAAGAAQLLGLRDRGRLAPGMRADIVVFNSGIRDRSNLREPEIESEGIEWLLVNGVLKIAECRYLRGTPGMLLV